MASDSALDILTARHDWVEGGIDLQFALDVFATVGRDLGII